MSRKMPACLLMYRGFPDMLSPFHCAVNQWACAESDTFQLPPNSNEGQISSFIILTLEQSLAQSLTFGLSYQIKIWGVGVAIILLLF